MRGITVAVLAACTALSLPAQTETEQHLLQVAGEAKAFLDAARGIVARETLQQTARKRHTRFRPRIGEDSGDLPAVQYVTREVTSEYGFTTFQEAPDALHELRQVISVDGREVAGHEKARTTLTMGTTSADDKVKKKILQGFEKYGLENAATDFGQIVLLFLKPSLPQYDFQRTRETFLGADPAVIYEYRQKDGPESFTIFEGRTTSKEPMQGELWVRKSDGVPLRVTMTIALGDGQRRVTHNAAVDYFKSALGPVLPASVRYEQYINDELFVENVSTYSDFQLLDGREGGSISRDGSENK